MIVAIVVPGIVQVLIFWATLKYLGIALGTLALMPGIFVNGIVAIFMLFPLAVVFLIGFVRSFGAALAGSTAMGYLIRRRQGPQRLTVLTTVAMAAFFMLLNGLMLFLARSQSVNPLDFAPNSGASYSMAYVSLLIGAIVNATVTKVILAFE